MCGCASASAFQPDVDKDCPQCIRIRAHTYFLPLACFLSAMVFSTSEVSGLASLAQFTEEEQALSAAQVIVEQFGQQIREALNNNNSPQLSDDTRAQLAACAEELQRLIAMLPQTTRDAFSSAEAKEMLRFIIARITHLQRRMEEMNKS